MKRKPTGFVAICQCGKIVGAMDYERTDRREAGAILGRWLSDGCTVMPHFTTNWSATVEGCQCHRAKAATERAPRPGERCQHCIDRHDGFYGSHAPERPFHDDDGKTRTAKAKEGGA